MCIMGSHIKYKPYCYLFMCSHRWIIFKKPCHYWFSLWVMADWQLLCRMKDQRLDFEALWRRRDWEIIHKCSEWQLLARSLWNNGNLLIWVPGAERDNMFALSNCGLNKGSLSNYTWNLVTLCILETFKTTSLTATKFYFFGFKKI